MLAGIPTLPLSALAELAELAGRLRIAGRFAEAADCWGAIALHRPACAATQHELGLSLFRSGDFTGAITVLTRATSLDPSREDFRLALARAQLADGDGAAARATVERIVARDPRSVEGWTLLGFVLESCSERDLSEEAYRAAIALEPGRTAPWCSLVRLNRLEDAAPLEALLRIPHLARVDRAALHYALGQWRDRRGDADLAFRHFHVANGLRLTNHDPDVYDALIEGIISMQDESFFEREPEGASDCGSPLFIVGLPRSGTSLVEQILGCHPAVEPLGERPEMILAAQRLPERTGGGRVFPGGIDDVDATVARRIAGDYLGAKAPLVSGVRYRTDKAPANATLLGLVWRVLPNARVIHCLRDARDAALSGYFQDFGDYQVQHTTNLEHLARHAEAHGRLSAHWRRVLPLRRYELVYERLVSEPEDEVRHLLEFLELPWEPACLDFHLSKRPVVTASALQVREPFHTRSIGRWRAYEEWLGPLGRLG